MINAMLILEDMAGDDQLEVRVKDFGMFTGSHAMGLVGPQVIAVTRVPVNQEVDGYVELKPMKWLALNGPPVIQMKIRWALIGEPGSLPGPGSTGVLVNAWQAITVNTLPSAPSVSPSAPVDDGSGVNLESIPEEVAMGDNTDVTTSPADMAGGGIGPGSGVPEEMKKQEGSGVPEENKKQGTGGSSSSVFYIDPVVFEFSKPNDALRSLVAMQEKGGSVYPFPASVSKGMNYHCLAASFDPETGEHATLWGPVREEDLPTGLFEVHDAMETFAVSGQANPHWCSGVLVLLSWLKALKDCSSAVL